LSRHRHRARLRVAGRRGRVAVTRRPGPGGGHTAQRVSDRIIIIMIRYQIIFVIS